MTLRTRIWLVAVTGFWLAMLVLLCRAEFGARHSVVSAIPPGVVWKKMLSAPDHSRLEIRYGTNSLGVCVWRPDIGQERATGVRPLEEEEFMEGLAPRLAYYTLDVDGSAAVPDLPTRLRFSTRLKLDTNFAWQTFETSVRVRPDLYEVFANASEQTVRVRVDAGGDDFDRRFRFTDFQNPQRLLQEFGGPMWPAMIAALGVPLSTNKLSAASLGLHWEARNDFITVGRNRVRAYRLHAKLFDRWKINIFVSPVGEILRAELPANIVLINEQLTGLRNTADDD
jgi:hypothetical protein